MQALIVTAYKDLDQLVHLIESAKDDFKLFIHIDKKSKSLYDKLNEYCFSNTSIYSMYSITWGGYNHLLAILELLKRALEDSDIEYIHIISGQDIIVRDYKSFEDKFGKTDLIFMSCSNIINAPTDVKDRFMYWIPSSNWNLRRILPRFIIEMLCMSQKLLHMKRRKLGDFNEVYKGMIWGSMPRKVVQYMVDYAYLNPSYMKALLHTRLPEEFFFQTVLMNSGYKNQVVCENLRYTDWTHRNGSTPAILDETDYNKIVESNCYFARKMDSNVSGGLTKLIDAFILQTNR